MSFIQIEDELGAHNYKPLDVIISRGERVWVAPANCWQTGMKMPNRM